MFVDTSAIVAILCGEPDAAELAQRLAVAERRFTSPVVRLEACMVLASRLDIAPAQANALFDDFLEEANLSIIPINDKIGVLAVACFETFGKGRHPARTQSRGLPVLCLRQGLSFAASVQRRRLFTNRYRDDKSKRVAH